MDNHRILQFLEQGLQAARAGDYFEAHEHWEDAWRQMSGASRTFWQAMIQLVVALVHLERGNPRGFARLCSKALARCQQLEADRRVADLQPVLALKTLLLRLQETPAPQPGDLEAELTAFFQQIELENWLRLDGKGRSP